MNHDKKKGAERVTPRFELGLCDLEPEVLTTTPYDHRNEANYFEYTHVGPNVWM